MPEVNPPKIAVNKKPPPKDVIDFHTNSDKDGSQQAQHHSLGPGHNQAAPGDHSHDGGTSTRLSPLDGTTISGSRSSGTALTSVIAALVSLGATDTTTA